MPEFSSLIRRFCSASAAVVCLAVCLLGGDLRAAERPNVVLVLCDDIRWDALSCAGHPHLKTPHIDRLASEGLYFENMFCTTSLCSPSRASILSGLYAHAHGITNNFTDYPAELASFPRTLQSDGYRTAYIGKWHMGEQNDEPRPGFDTFITHKGQGKYFDTEFNIDGQGARVVPGYYTTVVTDMAIDWLGKQDVEQKPFMLMLGQKAPHSFYFPEPKYEHSFDDVEINYPHSSFQLEDKPQWIRQRLKTWHGIYGPLFDWRKEFPDDSAEGVMDFARMVRAYWGTILSVDDSVGRLVAKLEQMGQLDNTVFVFMGDNGLLEGEHGMVDKRTAHEASIRVPMIIRYPRLTPEGGKRVPQQVLTVDVAPTILDLCGVSPLKNIHGRSVRRMVTGESKDWRTGWLYYYNYEKQFPYTPNVRALRTDRWKLIRYPHGDGSPDRHMAELYDLQADPGERHNLIKHPEHQQTVKQLAAQLVQVMNDLGLEEDPMPLDEGIGQELPDEAIR
ncbi:sulfatase family protein [Roseimaritima ulvae]|uniref:Arylsulfatase n=1 Tax=Roseimaritima ulvae TaxID=980254 RepID=A0A5B9QX27_9BACT|nr:sulfatase [Roseimaritima ulvae]QEG41666.1 Arylsulfatase [Roseimaritima ulvae]